MKLHTALLAGLLLCAPLSVVMAQERIALDEATLNRLGLVFAQVAAPDAGDGARFSATVIASPETVTALHALHSGVVERWEVQAGQTVKQGDVVAVLRSEHMLQLQQDWIAASARDIESRAALTRDRLLFEEGVIAAQRLEQTQRIAQEASFNLQAQSSALDQSGYPRAELDALRSGDTAPGFYPLRAPADGTVTQLLHTTGDLVSEGEMVITLVGDGLWVEAAVPARLASRIAVSQTLQLADAAAMLTVRHKNQVLDPRTQTQIIRAEFIDPVHLLPGQVVTVRLPPQAGGIVVPADAVVRKGDDTTVFVRYPGGVESRVLQLQPIGSDYLAMTGLEAGEQVVVRGASLIKGITLGLGGE